MDIGNILSTLTKGSTYSHLKKTYGILGFYFGVVVIMTTLGYAIHKEKGVDYGMLVGVLISGFLWVNYGKTMSY
jgi:hypothetical protein